MSKAKICNMCNWQPVVSGRDFDVGGVSGATGDLVLSIAGSIYK
jgi:hypothetical protein